MLQKLEFLTSTRFWALIIGAFSVYLNNKGWIGEAEMQLIATITGIFITIKTVDRTVDKTTFDKSSLPSVNKIVQ